MARLFLFLSLPFWFPRLVFSLILDFWNYHFVDWVHDLQTPADEQAAFAVIPGERPDALEYGQKIGKYRQSNGLRLIQGGKLASPGVARKRHASRN